ncbi:hypothetical protein V5O48_015741 [Marasmius crinis-equi]|uniref:CCHC-type domain-containing protein n=1 Tax=Marasmius crinis-equi TaxID=585013 RepID=A0ABR3ETN3_9AGAR
MTDQGSNDLMSGALPGHLQMPAVNIEAAPQAPVTNHLPSSSNTTSANIAQPSHQTLISDEDLDILENITISSLPPPYSREAPRTFKGSYAKVEGWIQQYERVVKNKGIRDGRDRCEGLLDYCSLKVKRTIRSLPSFRAGNWYNFKAEILRLYDAERARQQYQPSDIQALARKQASRPIDNLSKWLKYRRKFQRKGGELVPLGRMTEQQYATYFWLGIPENLRNILEIHLKAKRPLRSNKDPHSIADVCDAAEQYFSRSHFMSTVPDAEAFGTLQREEDSGDDSDTEDETDSDEDEMELWRRLFKGRGKTKGKGRDVRTTEKVTTPSGSDLATKEKTRTTQFTGPQAEVADLISRLNNMQLENPEYGAMYYRATSLDPNSRQCITRSPPIAVTPMPSAPKPYPTPASRPMVPVTNDGRAVRLMPFESRPSQGFRNTCFACGDPNHKVPECPEAAERQRKGDMRWDNTQRKYVTRDGRVIDRRPGENMLQALDRMLNESRSQERGSSTTSMLLTIPDAVRNYYTQQRRETRKEGRSIIPSDYSDDIEEKDEWNEEADDIETEEEYDEVADESEYSSEEEETEDEEENLVMTSTLNLGAQRQLAKSKDARNRMQAGPREVAQDIRSKRPTQPPLRADGTRASWRNSPRTPRSAPQTQEAGPQASSNGHPIPIQSLPPSQVSVNPSPPNPAPTSETSPTTTPEAPLRAKPSEVPIPQRPYDARPMSYQRAVSLEPELLRPKVSREAKSGSSGVRFADPEAIVIDPPAKGKTRAERKSDLARRVSKQAVMERLLGAQVQVSLGEILGSSRELSTVLHDMTKVRMPQNKAGTKKKQDGGENSTLSSGRHGMAEEGGEELDVRERQPTSSTPEPRPPTPIIHLANWNRHLSFEQGSSNGENDEIDNSTETALPHSHCDCLEHEKLDPSQPDRPDFGQIVSDLGLLAMVWLRIWVVASATTLLWLCNKAEILLDPSEEYKSSSDEAEDSPTQNIQSYLYRQMPPTLRSRRPPPLETGAGSQLPSSTAVQPHPPSVQNNPPPAQSHPLSVQNNPPPVQNNPPPVQANPPPRAPTPHPAVTITETDGMPNIPAPPTFSDPGPIDQPPISAELPALAAISAASVLSFSQLQHTGDIPTRPLMLCSPQAFFIANENRLGSSPRQVILALNTGMMLYNPAIGRTSHQLGHCRIEFYPRSSTLPPAPRAATHQRFNYLWEPVVLPSGRVNNHGVNTQDMHLTPTTREERRNSHPNARQNEEGEYASVGTAAVFDVTLIRRRSLDDRGNDTDASMPPLQDVESEREDGSDMDVDSSEDSDDEESRSVATSTSSTTNSQSTSMAANSSPARLIRAAPAATRQLPPPLATGTRTSQPISTNAAVVTLPRPTQRSQTIQTAPAVPEPPRGRTLHRSQPVQTVPRSVTRDEPRGTRREALLPIADLMKKIPRPEVGHPVYTIADAPCDTPAWRMTSIFRYQDGAIVQEPPSTYIGRITSPLKGLTSELYYNCIEEKTEDTWSPTGDPDLIDRGRIARGFDTTEACQLFTSKFVYRLKVARGQVVRPILLGVEGFDRKIWEEENMLGHTSANEVGRWLFRRVVIVFCARELYRTMVFLVEYFMFKRVEHALRARFAALKNAQLEVVEKFGALLGNKFLRYEYRLWLLAAWEVLVYLGEVELSSLIQTILRLRFVDNDSLDALHRKNLIPPLPTRLPGSYSITWADVMSRQESYEEFQSHVFPVNNSPTLHSKGLARVPGVASKTTPPKLVLSPELQYPPSNLNSSTESVATSSAAPLSTGL